MMTITGLSHLFKWENLHYWTSVKLAPHPTQNVAKIVSIVCAPFVLVCAVKKIVCAALFF